MTPEGNREGFLTVPGPLSPAQMPFSFKLLLTRIGARPRRRPASGGYVGPAHPPLTRSPVDSTMTIWLNLNLFNVDNISRLY